MEHKLKILPQYFKAVQEGNKTFEIRKNDRGFKVGDILVLKEWYPGDIDYKNDIATPPYYTGQEITKEVSYILEGGQYGLEERNCILGLKQEGIKLQNINLTGISKLEQVEKVREEREEFYKALLVYTEEKTEKNKIHVIDELLDEFQAKLGLIEKEGIKAEEVQEYYSTWVKKLDNRPRKKECTKCIFYEHCNKKIKEENRPSDCKSYEEQEE